MLRRSLRRLGVVPTAEDYRKLSVPELEAAIELRDKQVAQLKGIYELYQNDVEGKFRRQVYDYHDKAIDFSKVHGQVQQRAMSHHREILKTIREQDWKEEREKNLVIFLCVTGTLCYYLWVQAHYFKKPTSEDRQFAAPTLLSNVTAGPGMFAGTWLQWDSSRYSGRTIPTNWEREKMEEARRKGAAAANSGGGEVGDNNSSVASSTMAPASTSPGRSS